MSVKGDDKGQDGDAFGTPESANADEERRRQNAIKAGSARRVAAIRGRRAPERSEESGEEGDGGSEEEESDEKEDGSSSDSVSPAPEGGGVGGKA